jgi:hypothetical protein
VAKQVLTPPAAASRPGTEPSPSDQLVREILEAVDLADLLALCSAMGREDMPVRRLPKAL